MLCGFTKCILKKKKSHLKLSYSASWAPITVDEFRNDIALLFYMPILTDPTISAYWSQSSPLLLVMGHTFLCDKVNINR